MRSLSLPSSRFWARCAKGTVRAANATDPRSAEPRSECTNSRHLADAAHVIALTTEQQRTRSAGALLRFVPSDTDFRRIDTSAPNRSGRLPTSRHRGRSKRDQDCSSPWRSGTVQPRSLTRCWKSSNRARDAPGPRRSHSYTRAEAVVPVDAPSPGRFPGGPYGKPHAPRARKQAPIQAECPLEVRHLGGGGRRGCRQRLMRNTPPSQLYRIPYFIRPRKAEGQDN